MQHIKNEIMYTYTSTCILYKKIITAKNMFIYGKLYKYCKNSLNRWSILYIY